MKGQLANIAITLAKVLVNAETGQVGFSTQMSGYVTNQDLSGFFIFYDLIESNLNRGRAGQSDDREASLK